ncbi:hypothetical protein ACQY0O_001346 [Thecaphora frezii]
MSYRRPAPRTTLFVAGTSLEPVIRQPIRPPRIRPRIPCSFCCALPRLHADLACACLATSSRAPGFPPTMRARDLAYEFERMGRLVRCDIPALRSPNATPYAFVEYEDPRDAEAAHHDMHGMRFGRYALSIQFAKNAPSSNWRFDGPSRRGPPPPPAAAPLPPRRRELSASEQEEADRAAEERARARAAARERERSRSPGRRRDDGDYTEDRRSSSRRADERDADDERRRRYDDEDRGRDPIDDERSRERSYGGDNGAEANGHSNGRDKSVEADVAPRESAEEPSKESAPDGDAAQAVSN